MRHFALFVCISVTFITQLLFTQY